MSQYTHNWLLKFSYTFLFLFFAVTISVPQSGSVQIGPQEKELSQKERLLRINPDMQMLTPAKSDSLWREVFKVKSYTSHGTRNTGQWQLAGPFGALSSQGIDFVCSGRIRDVEILNENHLRVATASGGLWDIKTGTNGSVNYENISAEQVTSAWSGTVASDPFDSNTILYGTGEPALRIGTGLWRTTDAGKNWSKINMPGGMSAFDEMDFTDKKGKVWCAGSDGVFYSDDGGLVWQKKRAGNYPGMVIFPEHPDTVLVSEYDRGIFRTTNGGQTWQKSTTGLPANGFSRIELANCKTQPNVIYALYTTTQNTTMGIYKTTNSGDSWTRCTVIDANGVKDVDYHWGMAWYCSFISVSPVNPDHVISGGGWYVYSKDGQNFYGPIEGQHADFHAGGWSGDGRTAWYANDGGIYATLFDEKWKWVQKFNQLPITQFGSLAVSRTNPDVIIGGTQDNGLVYYNSTGKKWFYYLGDGGGVAIDPTNENKMYGTLGLSGDPLSFRNVRKMGPSAAGWQDGNTGLFPSGQWWRIVRTDYNQPAVIYTQADEKVYYSENEGLSWNLMSFGDIDITDIHSMRISHGEFPNIYISGGGPDSSSCMVLDLSIYEWVNISKGLPTKNWNNGNYSVPHVFTSVNPNLESRVYAVMRGFGPHLQGKHIFRSDNKGLDWTNISGNLPDLPYTIVFEHPENDNILITGTDGFGVFITVDGGKEWQRWDTGLPLGTTITDVDYQKHSNDSLFVVISTYGHSIYRRYLPASTSVNTTEIQKPKYKNAIISAAYDNGAFLLKLSPLQVKSVHIKCCNAEGKVVFSNHFTIQNHTPISLETGHLPPGFYVISVTENGFLAGTIRCVVL